MTLIVALVAVFLWLGLSAREFDRRTQRRLVALIVVLVVVDLLRKAVELQ